MRNTRLLALGATLLFFCLSLAPLPAQAAKTMKLAHLNSDDPFDNATGAMATVFKSLVEAGTNGSVEVQLFGSGQLGKDSEVLQQVKAGAVQSTIATTGGMASIYPLIGVMDVPFAYPNISATYAVLDGPFGQKLAADINKKTGLKVLGFGDSGGFFAITNSKRPVKSVADMKGLKIRTMGLKTHQTLVSSLGGQPASIAWAVSAVMIGTKDTNPWRPDAPANWLYDLPNKVRPGSTTSNSPPSLPSLAKAGQMPPILDNTIPADSNAVNSH